MTKQLLVHDKAKNVTRRVEKKKARIAFAFQVEPSVLKVVSLYRTQRHEPLHHTSNHILVLTNNHLVLFTRWCNTRLRAIHFLLIWLFAAVGDYCRRADKDKQK